ncbi:peptidase M15 [Candidatus Pacearchaeota archaeon]|nr:peptidase M15 [Candidatus Pacearchaeota archaeon]
MIEMLKQFFIFLKNPKKAEEKKAMTETISPGEQMTAEQAFWKNIRYFKKEDFADDKGEVWINKDLVLKVDLARDRAAIPFIVNSACRNPEHNRRVGGANDSSHLKGYALDLKVINSQDRFKVVSALIEVGLIRLGVSGKFIHVDNDPYKIGFVLWTY